MKAALVSEADRWRATADQLLAESGLLTFLKQRGEVYFTGSYRYGLMVSADIDVYLLHPQAGKQQARGILQALIEQAYWNAFMYGDWVQFRSPDMPVGHYVGLKRDFAGARWKVDIWDTPEVSPPARAYNEWLERSLTPERRELILALKQANLRQKWDLPGVTIYDAVLTGQVQNVAEFRLKFIAPPAGDRT